MTLADIIILGLFIFVFGTFGYVFIAFMKFMGELMRGPRP